MHIWISITYKIINLYLNSMYFLYYRTFDLYCNVMKKLVAMLLVVVMQTDKQRCMWFEIESSVSQFI